MSFLKNNNLGTTTRDHFQVIRENVVNRWETVGFLDGLKGQIKENMAQLYENEANYLINESTVSDVSGSFETVVFPIVRRIFSKLLANDIVSVQAMNLPIGKLFFFLPKISQRAENGAHPGLADQLPECVELDGCVVSQFEKKSLYDMFYNDGIFDHSKGKKTINVSDAVAPIDPNKAILENVITALTTAPVDTTGEGVRKLVLAIEKFEENQGKLAFKAGKSGVSRADGTKMDTESFLGSLKVFSETEIVDRDGKVMYEAAQAIPFRLVTQRYGQGIVEHANGTQIAACDANGRLYVELDLSHPVSLEGVETHDGFVGAKLEELPTFKFAFAEYETLEMATEMGEVSFQLSEVTVSTEERKLRATWSPELAQDVNAFHNIDAEAELTAILSEQIAAEIDREILKDLRVAAPWTSRWDVNGWKRSSMASTNYTQKDWNQTLITAINQISAQIQKATLRGGASYIVVSTEVSAVLNDLEYFHVSDASAESEQYNMGITKAGTIGGRYTVYVDPYSPSDSIIIGHKGKSILDTGYIYAPYVPLQLTPTVINPYNFAPVKGISTRYAKKVVNNRFFGHIKVDGLKVWNIEELR